MTTIERSSDIQFSYPVVTALCCFGSSTHRSTTSDKLGFGVERGRHPTAPPPPLGPTFALGDGLRYAPPLKRPPPTAAPSFRQVRPRRAHAERSGQDPRPILERLLGQRSRVPRWSRHARLEGAGSFRVINPDVRPRPWILRTVFGCPEHPPHGPVGGVRTPSSRKRRTRPSGAPSCPTVSSPGGLLSLSRSWRVSRPSIPAS